MSANSLLRLIIEPLRFLATSVGNAITRLQTQEVEVAEIQGLSGKRGGI
jgi:hypothetical protein